MKMTDILGPARVRLVDPAGAPVRAAAEKMPSRASDV
jgi:hypothetical protein